MTTTPPTPLRRTSPPATHLELAEQALRNARAARADLADLHESARNGGAELDSRTLQRYSRRINNAIETANIEATMAQTVAIEAQTVAIERAAEAVERLALGR